MRPDSAHVRQKSSSHQPNRSRSLVLPLLVARCRFHRQSNDPEHKCSSRDAALAGFVCYCRTSPAQGRPRPAQGNCIVLPDACRLRFTEHEGRAAANTGAGGQRRACAPVCRSSIARAPRHASRTRLKDRRAGALRFARPAAVAARPGNSPAGRPGRRSAPPPPPPADRVAP